MIFKHSITNQYYIIYYKGICWYEKDSWIYSFKRKWILWYYDGEKLTIERTFKNKEEKSEFYNDEIDMIIKYIKNNGQVDLSNSVSKVYIW